MKKTLFALLLLILSASVFAQDDTTTSEDEDATEEARENESPASVPVEEVEAFQQGDLQVLVGSVQRPNGIAWLDGHLFTACNGDWTLYDLDDTTGFTETVIFGVRNAHTLHAEKPGDVAVIWVPDFDRDGLFVVDESRGAPREITRDLDGPWGIAELDGQNFLITNYNANNVVKVSRTGQIEPMVTGLRSPAGIVIDGDLVYVANAGSARRAIEWFDMTDPAMELHSLVSGLQNVTNLVMADDGYLYFTHALGTRGVVSRVFPADCLNGECMREDIEQVVVTDLTAPLAGLVVTPDMRLFVHTIYRPQIYWVALDGSSVPQTQENSSDESTPEETETTVPEEDATEESSSSDS